MPLDLYNIASELSFYQAKMFQNGKIQEVYPIIGRHIFGIDSLMYRYWANNTTLSGKTLILISPVIKDFDWRSIHEQGQVLYPPKKLMSRSQGRGVALAPYYYEVVRLN